MCKDSESKGWLADMVFVANLGELPAGSNLCEGTCATIFFVTLKVTGKIGKH